MSNLILIFYVLPLLICWGVIGAAAFVPRKEPTSRGELLTMMGISMVPILNVIVMIGVVGSTVSSPEVQEWLSKPIRKPSK